MTFTANTQKIAQILLVAVGTLLPVFWKNLDVEQKAAIVLFSTTAQALIGIQGHGLTPDGRKVNDVLADVPAKEPEITG